MPDSRRFFYGGGLSKVRVAVIGAGAHGRRHAEKYSASARAELVAVIDADAAVAQAVASRHGVLGLSHLANILSKVDAVSIVVPTRWHYAMARDCLLAGLDVLVEKPITLEPAQAKQLIALAAQRQRVLQVGHIERFNPAVRALAPRICTPRYLGFSRVTTSCDRTAAICIGLDLMIHDIDLACWMVGRPIIAIEAVGQSVLSSTLDILQARLRFQGGCVADLFASRVSARPERRMHLMQAGACVWVDLLSASLVFVDAGSGPLPTGGGALQPVALGGDALEAEIESFLDCVIGRTAPLVDGLAGKAALEAALAIGEAAAQEASFGRCA
jgi:predicted dehydrogenase